ncbi:MAG: DUF805 domain-containing protein [Myxococcota bacterium]|nr:DUF805 domain-containing protein [Myxococcota bacterium]
MQLFSILFGAHKPITRKLYFTTGVTLMVLKYSIDAGAIYALSGAFLPPWFYLLPIASLKLEGLQQINELWLGVYVLWTLLFMWIGASMTYRRLQDAGKSPMLTILFFVPFINYFALLFFALIPPREGLEDVIMPKEIDQRWWLSFWGSAVAGTLIGAFVVVLFSVFSVFVIGEYGLALFAGLPFVNGFIVCSLFNTKETRTLFQTVVLSQASVAFSGLTLILLAFEGVLCVAMLAPFALVLAGIGGFLAWYLTRGSTLAVPLAIVLIPLLAIAEPKLEAPLQEVQSSVVIDASPQQVWSQVVAFSELPRIARWFFKLGIAYPIRARLEGEGIGAIRYCEFSTGAFIEPITRWDEPNRLSFDVIAQPPTMEEWSFYEHIHAPHITESLKSRRGEFRLIELEDGRTRLEGSTWYTQDLKPYWYWYRWSDFLIHAIHTRVLEHIKSETEAL